MKDYLTCLKNGCLFVLAVHSANVYKKVQTEIKKKTSQIQTRKKVLISSID